MIGPTAIEQQLTDTVVMRRCVVRNARANLASPAAPATGGCPPLDGLGRNCVVRLLFVLVGWILGLGSHAIISAVTTAKTKRDVRTGIRVELQDRRYRLAALVYDLSKVAGAFDRQRVEWVRNTVAAWVPEGDNIHDALSRLLRRPDPDIEQIGARRRADTARGKSLRQVTLPYLDSQLPTSAPTQLRPSGSCWPYGPSCSS